jgi:hypothetical protein
MSNLYYTQTEGGYLQQLPIQSMRGKIIKKLNRHRRIIHGEMRTHIKVQGFKPPYTVVHSVFWLKNGKIVRIWDASIGGRRK